MPLQALTQHFDDLDLEGSPHNAMAHVCCAAETSVGARMAAVGAVTRHGLDAVEDKRGTHVD